MPEYEFQAKDFALSQQGVHLLRNRFNYNNVDFNDINKASITRAVETNNVVLTLIAGALLLAFAIYQSIGVYEAFYDPSTHIIYTESISVIVFPLLLGFYCIYISVKKIPVLIVEVKSKKHKLILKDVVKAGRIYDLESYLKKQLKERFYYSTT